jgi:elongation factor Ts
MEITAAMVKDLRERTGCGMMECKKALVESAGDIDKAIEEMRKKGLAKNDKLASRVAAEGRVACAVSEDGKNAVIVEVNSETDFVANGDQFSDFVSEIANLILTKKPATLEEIPALEMRPGQDVKAVREELLLKLGENIQIRRFQIVSSVNGHIAHYMHGSRIGVLVDVENDASGELGKDLAMHIAASNPAYLSVENVSPEFIAKEKEILTAQAAESGKPAEIIEKMIEGRLRKQLAEVTLMGQPFVKDPDQTVEKLVKSKGAKVLSFVRYAVGEGIEKKQENFAEEVMAQVSKS